MGPMPSSLPPGGVTPMVNMVGQGNIILMEQAILAPPLRPLPDVPAQRHGDVHGRHAGLLRRRGGKARTRFEEQEEMVDLGVDLQCGGLFGG